MDISPQVMEFPTLVGHRRCNFPSRLDFQRGAALVLLTSMCVGCQRRIDSSKLPGNYYCVYDYGAEALQLKADGTYQQTIRLSNAKTISNISTWHASEERRTVTLDNAIVTDNGFGQLRKDLGPAQWTMPVLTAGGGYAFCENDDRNLFFRDN